MRDPRNLAIALLAVLVVVLGILLWRRPSEWLPAGRPIEPGLTPVALIDLMPDRERRGHVDLLFDRPLGADKVGEVLDPAPATVEPETGGVWRWQGANVLRFDVSGRLEPATRYEITLDPAVLVGADHAYVGEIRLGFETDHFQVDRVDVREELAPEGRRRIVLRGTVFFNYPVEPEELASRIRLEDPAAAAPVAVELETRAAQREILWRSVPIEKLAQARELRLRVAADLTPATGNVPLPAEFVSPIPVGSGERLAVRGLEATPGEEDSTLRIELSSPVRPDVARRHLTIDPDVAFDVRAERNVLVLRGAFRPGGRYALRIARGLVAADDAVLAEDWTHTVRLTDLPATVEFTSSGMFLSASGPRTLEIETTNVPKVDLTVERIYRSNVLWLLEQRRWDVWTERAGYGDLAHIYGDRIAEQTLEITAERNRSARTALRLDDYVKDEAPGLFRVVVARHGQAYDRRQQWALVTDLGIVAKRTPEEVLVWVFSFRDLAPVAGARVVLWSDQSQVLAEGRTDPRGALRLGDLAGPPERRRPALVTVESASDWSFLPFERTRVDTAGLDVGGASPRQSGYDAFLYGERDLYRPGETARGVVLVRDGDLGLPPDMPLVLRHRDPEGQVRSETRLDLNDGAAEFAHDIPAYERTGAHSFDLLVGEEAVGSYRLQVEEFVPDRIRVEIATERDQADPDQPLAYAVSSAYLFGPPAAGLAVESRVRLVAAEFRPEGFEGFVFGNQERKFDAREIFAREAQLDEAGRLQLSVPIPRGLRAPSALEARITARVQEQGGRGVTASERVRVHPVRHYLGLRREAEGYAEPGRPVAVEFAAVRPDGSEATAGTLRAEFFADRWQTVLRRTPSGSYRYESKREPRLLTSERLEAGLSRGRLEFTPPEYGGYRIVLTDEEAGASTQLSFYASGWGFAPWAVEAPGRVELDLEQDDVAIGGQAVVQVRSPFAGTLLLTVERDRVLHWEMHRMEGNTARVALPVLPTYRPNVHVTATVLRAVGDLEPGTAGRAFGAVPLLVDREPNRLEVAVEAPEEIRPERTLDLEVRTAPGAQVTLAAVDEGILQLIAQRTPDPFDHFYRRRALSVSSHDIFTLLLPDAEGAAATGGGRARALMEQFVRTEGIRRVEPVAFWSGLAEADARGVARVSFDLPEFQGALRVMAVASAGRRFGSVDRVVRVRSPLVLLPTFPRFLSFEERVQIPVTVRNDTGEDGRFEVALRADGPARVEGEATRSADVPDGRETTLYFDVATFDRPGELALALEASGNGETSSARVSLGVRADLPAITVERAGAVAEAVTALAVDDLARFRPEGLSVSLRLGPVPLVQLAGKLATLLRYPYGCLEQTVSRAFPLLHLAELARELEPELFEQHDPDAVVADAIAKVASMRLASGGFSLWPRGSSPDAWTSIYAAHLLVEAERAGHGVPAGLLEGALDFVANEAQPRPSYSAGALERTVYGLYVLARAGRADLGTMDFVRDKHARALRAAARAQLGAAYAASGDAEAIGELTRGLEDAERIRRQTGGNFASTTRDRALILLALLDAAPDDPRIPTLADRLARDALDQSIWSTQETGVALLALGQLFRRQAARAPYAGEVRAGGDTLARFGSDTVVLRDLPPGPLEIRMDPGYEAGSAFYSLRVRGIPTDAAFAPASEGLEIARRIRRRDGGGIDRVEQGDLLVLEIELRSNAGRLENVVIQNLLPSGLEVENARLATTEKAARARDERTVGALQAAHLDVRDDRLLVFTDLPDAKPRRFRALLRAVAPGRFRLPPVQAEAMYDGTIRAVGERDTLEVHLRGAQAP